MLYPVKLPVALAGLALLIASGATAQAPSQADQLKLAYQNARNQVGLMTYCNEKGFVGTDVVEIQKKMLGMIPPVADKSVGDAAEADGRKGMTSMMGVSQSIEAIAKATNGTAETFCKQMGDVMKKVGAALK